MSRFFSLLAAVAFIAAANVCLAGDIPRPEHPQPQSVRAAWASLNGEWEFEFDDAGAGLAERWQQGGRPFTRKINVPFPFQAKLSGIGDTTIHHDMWHRRKFDAPAGAAESRTLLHFGAVDYECKVWLNQQFLGSHRGGHVPFSFDITDAMKPAGNELVVWARDTEDQQQPRGKQHWIPKPNGIWYTRTSGIWQSVWLESVGRTYIESFKMTPRIDSGSLEIEVAVAGDAARWAVQAKAFFAGQEVASSRGNAGQERISLRIPGAALWTPEAPNLYDITFTLFSGKGEAAKALDEVKSYFGMRKISIEGNKLLLNNKPYYQRLVLDQGYWPEGILAPPSDDALRFDIEMSKKFGFNGARKHQKIEDPRWHYWCDRLGYLVWGEMANASPASAADARAQEMFDAEWLASVERDYNHPCVVAWTPFNETWGIRGVREREEIQRWVERVYNLTKKADPFRPVCDNSGWEHTLTDIADLHNYTEKGPDFLAQWKDFVAGGYAGAHPPKNPVFYVEGKGYGGEPIVLSEYGGIGLKIKAEEVIGSDTKPWSYGSAATDVESYFERYKSITEAIQSVDEIWGFCYTQLTDVEHEVNGVMTYDRKPKIDPARIREINEKRR